MHEELLDRKELRRRLRLIPAFDWAGGRYWKAVRDTLPFVQFPGAIRKYHRMSDVLAYLSGVTSTPASQPPPVGPVVVEVPLHRRRSRLKKTG